MLRHRCYCAGVLRPTLSGAWTPGSTWSGMRPRLKVQQGVPRSSTTPSPQSTDRMAFCPSPGQAATAALSQTQFSCPGFNSLFFWSESKLVTFEADCNKIQLLWNWLHWNCKFAGIQSTIPNCMQAFCRSARESYLVENCSLCTKVLSGL